MKRIFRRNALVACVAFALGLLVAVLIMREPMERLGEEALGAARTRWTQARIGGYDLRYEMNGSVFDVQVRDGIVVEVFVGGVRPVSADWGNYSVHGLFALLERELENLSDAAGPFGGHGAAVFARVRFNDRLGYPERYLRSGGGARSARVQVRMFRVVAR